MSGKPIGRERNVVGGEAKVERQGEGLGQGPVGNREGNTGLGGQNRPGPGRPGNQGPRNAPPSAPRPGNGPKEAPQQADKGIISDLLGGGNNSGNNNGGILGGLMGGNNNNTNNNNSGLGGLGGLGGGNNHSSSIKMANPSAAMAAIMAHPILSHPAAAQVVVPAAGKAKARV